MILLNSTYKSKSKEICKIQAKSCLSKMNQEKLCLGNPKHLISQKWVVLNLKIRWLGHLKNNWMTQVATLKEMLKSITMRVQLEIKVLILKLEAQKIISGIKENHMVSLKCNFNNQEIQRCTTFPKLKIWSSWTLNWDLNLK